MSHGTLIISGTSRVAAPVARSLSRRNIPVFMVSLDAESASLKSRSIRRNVDLSASLDAARVCAITEMIQREDIDCIFPGNDSALLFVADHYDRLSSLAVVAAPPPETLYCVLNKERTLQAAAECSVEAPRSYRFEDRNDLASASGSLPFPLVAKGFSKQVMNISAFKTRYYRDYRSLERDYELDPDYGRKYMLQEFAPGEGFGIEVIMDEGEPHLMFAHRRLKEYPTTGGVSVIAEAVTPPPALVERALRLLRHIGWNGIAMVEFRWDRATGRITLMEINGRFWGSLALSQACGVDFAYAAWRHAHHLPAEPQHPHTTGKRGRWTSGVLLRIQEVSHPQSDGMPRPGFAKELLSAAASFRPGIHDLLWRWQDPRPALDELRRLVSAMARDETKRLVRACLPTFALEWRRAGRSLEPRAARIYVWRQFRDAWRPRRRRLPRQVRSVLFVCHGNIIRSPMAEVVFRKRCGIPARSAGLHAIQDNRADKRAVEIAPEFDVSLRDHHAVPVTHDLLAPYDLVVAMDRLNEARLLHRYPEAAAKVVMLGTFAPRRLPGDEIPDPFLLDECAIRDCYRTIDACVGQLAKCLEALS